MQPVGHCHLKYSVKSPNMAECLFLGHTDNTVCNKQLLMHFEAQQFFIKISGCCHDEHYRDTTNCTKYHKSTPNMR
jgi:hypothetical protein